MKVPCEEATCSKQVDTHTSHVQYNGRYFCNSTCSERYIRQEENFDLAIRGGPVWGRKPTKLRPWYQKDG